MKKPPASRYESVLGRLGVYALIAVMVLLLGSTPVFRDIEDRM